MLELQKQFPKKNKKIVPSFFKWNLGVPRIWHKSTLFTSFQIGPILIFFFRKNTYQKKSDCNQNLLVIHWSYFVNGMLDPPHFQSLLQEYSTKLLQKLQENKRYWFLSCLLIFKWKNSDTNSICKKLEPPCYINWKHWQFSDISVQRKRILKKVQNVKQFWLIKFCSKEI